MSHRLGVVNHKCPTTNGHDRAATATAFGNGVYGSSLPPCLQIASRFSPTKALPAGPVLFILFLIFLVYLRPGVAVFDTVHLYDQIESLSLARFQRNRHAYTRLPNLIQLHRVCRRSYSLRNASFTFTVQVTVGAISGGAHAVSALKLRMGG